MTAVTKHFVLAAGGTGGHMIPAYALGAELMQRGHHVALVTDDRGAKIPGIFDKAQLHILPQSRITGGIMGKLRGLRGIWAGRKMALELFRTFQPSAVVGFGGYPALPTLLAAGSANIPTVVHEQNAVLGRVNRLMARRVNAIATSYQKVERLNARYADKTHLVGNPVREEVLALRGQDYPPFLEGGVFRVLVTGGSQGAKIMSEVVPDGLAMLPVHLRQRLQVTQQCRADDIETVRAKYVEHGIPAELATYIEDLPDKLGWSHLVIGRAGASTIAELTVAGRPAILVPLPSSMDDHQAVNVREMVEAGGARAIKQSNFTAKELAKQIQKIALNPETMENAARGAWKCGLPNAVRDLADLVEGMGGAPLTDVIRIQSSGKKRRAMGGPQLAKDTHEGHSA